MEEGIGPFRCILVVTGADSMAVDSLLPFVIMVIRALIALIIPRLATSRAHLLRGQGNMLHVTTMPHATTGFIG